MLECIAFAVEARINALHLATPYFMQKVAMTLPRRPSGETPARQRSCKTDRELKALKPSDRWCDVKDEVTRNLIVRVGPLNAKGEFRRTFCLVTRFPGRSGL